MSDDNAENKSRMIADAALEKILRDMRGRSGLGDTWNDIDVDTRNEIINEWRTWIILAIKHEGFIP